MKNKNLLIIFGVLLAIYIGSKLFSSSTPDRSFNPVLLEIDTAAVTKIILNTKADNQEEVTLERVSGIWKATKGAKTVTATNGAIHSLLNQMQLVKTKRVAAKDQNKWTEYELEEGQGNKIKIYAGNQLLKEMIVGRFAFDQASRSATTFVRVGEEPNVYAIDGFLSMAFSQGFDAYRNKKIVDFRKEDITQLNLTSNGQTYKLTKTGTLWTAGGVPIDSTQMDAYLTKLSTLQGTQFVDDFDKNNINNEVDIEQLSIIGNNLIGPIEITSYNTTTPPNPFVIHSNLNKDAYFGSQPDGVYKSLIKDLLEILK